MEQCSCELKSFEEIVNKTKNTKAKAAFQLRLYIWETDQYFLQISCPKSKKTKNHWSIPMKDPKFKDSKTRP